MRAVIVDDEPMVREALPRFLNAHSIAVASVVGTVAAGIDAIRDHVPDVAVVDLNLPDATGVSLIGQAALLAPATKVLVLTGSDAETDVIESMRAGATGYLMKTASGDEIAEAVFAVARGEPVLSMTIANHLIRILRDGDRLWFAPAQDGGAQALLTPRELQILRLLAAGKDNAMIAGELSVSPHTVKNHVANILGKLHLENRIQAAVHAVRAGIA